MFLYERYLQNIAGRRDAKKQSQFKAILRPSARNPKHEARNPKLEEFSETRLKKQSQFSRPAKEPTVVAGIPLFP
jgi:hypothetical protein